MNEPNPVDQSRPPAEPWTQERTRPEWAPFDLPNSAIEMIEGEQLLEELGIRAIVTGLGSASPTDFINGIRKLKRILGTQYEDGFKAGQLNVLNTTRPRYALIALGIVIGITVGVTIVTLSLRLGFTP